VPNYSGYEVVEGQTVFIFYTGEILSSANAYIAGAGNRVKAVPFGFSISENRLGEVDGETQISENNFLCENDTSALIVFNAVVIGGESERITISAELDDNALEYRAIADLTSLKYNPISFTLPINVEKGEHTLIFKANGTGNFTAINSFVYGSGISQAEIKYDPTSDSDYIYEIKNDTSNVIYYIGNSTRPAIPVLLNAKPVKILRAVSFNSRDDVEYVYIPEGVEEIE
jgi:hypothetical protein